MSLDWKVYNLHSHRFNFTPPDFYYNYDAPLFVFIFNSFQVGFANTILRFVFIKIWIIVNWLI